MKPLYILSSCCISPQRTFEGFDGMGASLEYHDNVLHCVEPDFSAYINPVQIRRMSRALKIGYTAAIESLKRSGLESVDAIMIGTGKGCMSDTEKFLHSIKEYKETALNATHFIHSTYNQLNGMIALNKKISSYNMTYVHRAFSFEHTLIDTQLLFAEGEAQHVLVGSFDEMTQEHFTVKKHWEYWKKDKISNLDLLHSKTVGTIAGEGSSFYVLGHEKPEGRSVAIKHVATIFKPNSTDIKQAVNRLLEEQGLLPTDIDILICGENGNYERRSFYHYMRDVFSSANDLYYKHLCGEYDTAVNFGFWLGSQILKEQRIPQNMEMNSNVWSVRSPLRHVLLYNNYFELNHSLILLSLED